MGTTLRWGNPPTGIHNVPIYVGMSAGIFAAPGVTITANDNITGADYTEEVVAGRLDMGHMGTPPLFAALNRTREIAIVGQGLVRYPPFYVLTAPSVNSISQLKGRRVAINERQTCPHSILRTLLRWHALDETDVDLVTLIDGWEMASAAGRNDLAAVVIWEPYASYLERAHGWRIVANGHDVIRPSNYAFCLWAQRGLIREAPDLLCHMLAGYSRSVAHVKAHPKSVGEYVGRFPLVSPSDVEHGIARESALWSADLAVDPVLMKHVIAELEIQGIVDKQFVLDQYLEEARR